MPMKRCRFRFSAWMIAVALTMLLVGTASASAWASGGLRVTSISDNPYTGGSGHFMRVDQGTGNVAYCAQGWLRTPLAGQSLEKYGGPGIPELDYVLWHGYDGTVVASLEGMDRARSEAATAAAVWLAIADQRADILTHHDADGSVYHGNKGYMLRWELMKDPKVKDAAWRLYQSGLAYKKRGGGGTEAGCATLWLNKNMSSSSSGPTADFQALVTVEKTVEVSFSKTSAQASVTDGNKQYSLAGATYDIYLADGDKKVATITTDDHGKASLNLLPNRRYYALERKAPDGFILNPERIPFTTGNSGGSVSTKDKPGRFTLTISKKDAATGGEPQPGATLEGAEYRVTSLSTPGWMREGTTDSNGILSIEDVPYGEISVVETKAPEGYLVDPTVRTYRVDAPDVSTSQQIALIPEHDFRETPIAFDIEVAKFKTDGGEGSKLESPAEGVSFEIVSGTTREVVGSITTGKDGFASTEGRWFGTGARPDDAGGALPYDRNGYTVREVASTVPDGYARVDDWTISPEQMANAATLHYIVNNSRLESRLQIVKRDRADGAVVPLKGFSFQIIDSKNQIVEMRAPYPNREVIDTFSTDETGSVTLPEPLKTGSYRLREVRSVPPYLICEQEVPFEISGKNGQADPVTAVSLHDAAATGSATIRKTCSHDGKPLANAEFDVVAMEDIVSPTGAMQVAKGGIAGHATTDEHGVATVGDLPLGKGTARYAFIETKPPQGHALDAEPIEFVLRYKDDSTPIVSIELHAENQPTELVIEKTSATSKAPLPGADFWIWKKEDEAAGAPREGFGAVAISTGSTHDAVALKPSFTHAELVLDTGQLSVSVRDEIGNLVAEPHGALLPPGSYAVELTAQDGSLTHTINFEAVAGCRHAIKAKHGLLGISCHVDSEPIAHDIELESLDGKGTYASTAVPGGPHSVIVNGKRVASINVEQGQTTSFELTGKRLNRVPAILKEGKLPITGTSDADGRIRFPHLPAGDYLICESKAPAGHIADWTKHALAVDGNGLILGNGSHTMELSNDCTKVDISKRDITTEEEVPGAVLEIRDARDKVIETWTSTNSPHRIEALEPGTYKLVEKMTPRTYDQATAVTFNVIESGIAQPIAIYDEPIKISGEVDKRQQIAEPIAPENQPNGDGKNRAGTTVSQDGSFSYTVDIRNTSSTWVDEFTVEDALQGASEGLSSLDSITTPVVHGDYDGLLNIWYRTSKSSGPAREGANATLDDGHDNPWLRHESTASQLGGDGRVVDYDGWRLWRKGVDASKAQHLAVADLSLPEEEEVVGIRLGYGRVEKGFASRSDEWGRRDLKHEHDDFEGDPPTSGDSAPLIVHMHATQAYRELAKMQNHVKVDISRNGGGNGLQDRDDDHVVQAPMGSELPQTGINLPWYLAGAAAACTLAGCAIWLKRR